jgi:hypothetical protein
VSKPFRSAQRLWTLALRRRQSVIHRGEPGEQYIWIGDADRRRINHAGLISHRGWLLPLVGRGWSMSFAIIDRAIWLDDEDHPRFHRPNPTLKLLEAPPKGYKPMPKPPRRSLGQDRSGLVAPSGSDARHPRTGATIFIVDRDAMVKGDRQGNLVRDQRP